MRSRKCWGFRNPRGLAHRADFDERQRAPLIPDSVGDFKARGFGAAQGQALVDGASRGDPQVVVGRLLVMGEEDHKEGTTLNQGFLSEFGEVVGVGAGDLRGVGAVRAGHALGVGALPDALDLDPVCVARADGVGFRKFAQVGEQGRGLGVGLDELFHRVAELEARAGEDHKVAAAAFVPSGATGDHTGVGVFAKHSQAGVAQARGQKRMKLNFAKGVNPVDGLLAAESGIGAAESMGRAGEQLRRAPDVGDFGHQVEGSRDPTTLAVLGEAE